MMRSLGKWTLIFATSWLTTSALLPAAQAVQFSDGTLHFAGVPRLVKARATNDRARSWGGRYYFTVRVPEDSTEPMGKLLLQRQEGADRFERFDSERTLAYLDDDHDQSVAVSNFEVDREQQTISATFEPPIQPGQTVTLGFSPVMTPDDGIYLWGVTAFPDGEKVASQFLGFGRLHFFRPNNSVFRH